MAEFYGQQSTAIPGDDILAEGFPFMVQAISLAASQGALKRGQVLGLTGLGTVALSAKSGNTGADTGLGSVSVTLGARALAGRYALRCTAAVNGGTPAQWSVKAPNGFFLPTLASSVAYATDHINLTVGVGTTAWKIGDELYVDVSSSGLAKAYSSAAVDGSQHAALILADDITVGDAAVSAVAYRTGAFARAKLTGLDAAAIAALEARSIFVR